MLIFQCRDLSRVVANFLHHQGLVKQAAKANVVVQAENALMFLTYSRLQTEFPKGC
jgi:hypothetical protein